MLSNAPLTRCSNCGHKLAIEANEAQIGPLSITLQGDCWWSDKPVKLTPSEAQVVFTLASNPGRAMTEDALLRATSSHGGPDTIKVVVHRIRRKFAAVDPSFDRLESVWGKGYRWSVLQQTPD